ncbi:hypothetical protein JCM11251_002402 [Rhodosporidiobolus azoricus]
MPLRLPPKPKKGKSKQLHIDYTSTDSARASAPSDWTEEDWLAEGTRQEEQGERYIIGPKAQRHCQNSITCYRLAASLSPSSFDARYNAARALQTLATEHLPPPSCLQALEQAIGEYREALAVLPAQSGGTARIDALFNLAQADVALYEMLDEGAAIVEGAKEKALQAAKEAKDLFVEVERLQRIEMEKVFGAEGPEDDAVDTSEMDDSSSVGNGSAAEVQAVETTIVTPQLIIDTLLESISLDVALSSSLDDTDPDQQTLQQSALSSLARAQALRTLVPRSASAPAQHDDLDLDLSLAHASILTTFSASASPASEEATRLLQGLLTSSPSPRVELLSLYADHLVESLPLNQPLATLLTALDTALQVYQRAASLLSNRLSPPKDIPPAHLPSLLSANLTAQATVHLLAYTLSSRALSLDPSLASTIPPTQLHQHLSLAHQLCLDATAAPKSGLSLTLSPSSASSPPAGTGAGKPSLALARLPASSTTDPRTDWRTLSALRGAYFTFLRVRLRMDESEEAWEGEGRLVWAYWRALGLGGERAGVGAGAEKGGEGEKKLCRREVEWWIEEEVGEGKVSEVMEEEARERELRWWTGLVQ